jgi:group II intron reverse transcriptase/maturase
MQTKLDLITSKAGEDRTCRINNVAYLLNEANLKECFGLLKRGKAAGEDGVTLETYGVNLEANLHDLVERMKRQAYKPQPVRRTYIPKANGSMRPLGIPAIEDKIIQKGMTRILEAIYEVDFLDCSYGFRPNRDCHQALKRLDEIIMTKPINHIIDADIKGFFDNVDHGWLKKFLEHRISDPNFMRLISRFLRNGYMEEGVLHKVEEGTPQGGVISPVLANVYLHYVLDLWLEKAIKPKCRGVVEMVRYADDFVICVQYKDEAVQILSSLKERMGKFCLELAEDKTRHIEFGRYAKQNAQGKGEKPATFNFLGFTHYIDRTRNGFFKLGRKTDSKKLRAKLMAMKEWIKGARSIATIKEIWQTLKAKLMGHFRYYGVSGNYRGIKRYMTVAIGIVMKWLNRRSQKKSFNWETFTLYMKRYPLPRPTIHHNLYTLKPVCGNTCEEPYVGNLQVRFCEGHSISHDNY